MVTHRVQHPVDDPPVRGGDQGGGDLVPGQFGQQPCRARHQRHSAADAPLEAVVQQHGELVEGDVRAGDIHEVSGTAGHRPADHHIPPGLVELMPEFGEYLHFGVPPEALGVDEGAVHVEQDGLQRGAFGRAGQGRGNRAGHPAHLP